MTASIRICWEAIAFILAYIVLRSAYIRAQYTKITKLYHQGDYERLIQKAEKRLKAQIKTAAIFPSQRIIQNIDHLRLMIGVSYFAQGNKDAFLQNINEIKRLDESKQFWLILYALLENNMEEAQKYYQIYINAPGKKVSHPDYLKGIYLYKCGNTAEGIQLLMNAQPDIETPLLKKILTETIGSSL